MIQQDIPIELMQAINESPYNQIDYDYLLSFNPAQIRIEEQKIADAEPPLPLSDHLTIQNIEIPSSEPTRTIRVRTYRATAKTELAVLLYFHGGAFIYGSPEQYDFIFHDVALALDVLIVSVDYRLAPEHPFPAALYDGYDVLCWLTQHAAELGGNPTNISIGGSSAGGTIAASLAQYTRDQHEIEIQHQYLVYPPLDHRLLTSSMQTLAYAPMQTKKSAALMWRHYLGHHIKHPLPYAVPLLQSDHTNLPPATIIVCEVDPLKDEAKAYAEKLRQANVSTELIEIKGATHAFDFFPTTMATEFLQRQTKLLQTILTP